MSPPGLLLTALLAAVSPLPQGAGLGEHLDRLVAPVEAEGDIRVGVAIEDLDGRRLWGHRPEEPRVLASNTKLLTTAAALLALPPDWRWRTRAWRVGGELRLRGSWDPSLRPGASGDGAAAFLDALAAALSATGSTALDRVVVEEPAGADPPRHPLWPAAQWSQPYAAGVTALAVAGGCIEVAFGPGNDVEVAPPLTPALAVELRSSRERGLLHLEWLEPDHRLRAVRGPGAPTRARLAFREPAGLVRRWLQAGLAARGVVPGEVVTAAAAEPAAGPPLLDWPSAWTLAEAVVVANKHSDNFTSEMLLRTLAVEAGEPPTAAAGCRVVAQVLGAEGVDPGRIRQVDGSGLARNAEEPVNLAAPADLCAVLRLMAERREGRIFFDSLLVGGQEGRLADRFTAPRFQPGRVHAKTGWIRGASTLSGYLLAGRDRILAFSILINYRWDGTPRTNNRRFKKLQEEILGTVLDHLAEEEAE